MLLWNPFEPTKYPDFTKKMRYLGFNPDYFGVPFFHFIKSDKYTQNELIDMLTWDAMYLIVPGYHAIENIYDVVAALPDEEAAFYKKLLRQMEDALSNHDGNAFLNAAERWPGLIDYEE